MPVLRVENLCKTYAGADEPACCDITFSVTRGEIFSLVGPSGCGKTTTLRAIAGFERPDHGRIECEGRVLDAPGVHVSAEKRGIGFVFQDYALFPHLNLLENVMFGLRSMSAQRKRERAAEVLDMVGLAKFGHRRPHDLSGGQQQRVALARAIAPGTKVVLLDEPFSNLDAELRASTRGAIRALVNRAHLSVVLVTHDQEEALSVADRVAVMRKGELLQMGAPEAVYAHPKNTFVAQFLGRSNLLHASARGRSAQTAIGAVQLDREAQGEVIVSIRPEHLLMEPANGDTRYGTIISREFKGHDLTFTVRQQGDEYLVQTDWRCPLGVGERVRMKPTTQAAVVDRLPEEQPHD